MLKIKLGLMMNAYRTKGRRKYGRDYEGSGRRRNENKK